MLDAPMRGGYVGPDTGRVASGSSCFRSLKTDGDVRHFWAAAGGYAPTIPLVTVVIARPVNIARSHIRQRRKTMPADHVMPASTSARF